MALASLSYEVRRPPRWNTFAAGMIINLVAVIALIVLGPHLTSWVPREAVASRRSITLVAPLLASANQPQPPHVPIAPRIAKVEAPKLAPPTATKSQQPKIEPPKVEVPPAEAPKIASAAPVVPQKPIPPKEVKTNVFQTGKSEVATVHQPAQQVQTGGFGDPNGVRGQGDPKRDTIAVAKLGSFELPTGSGKGNGSAGANGVSGTIRSSGFGNGVASRAPRDRSYGGGVAESGFGSPVVAGGGSTAQPAQKKPDLQPVEIIYKPRPDYTAEARQQRVEGEVLLEVVFGASGSLHVNRVVKGLGYGLDDKALAAAQQIKFRPARRDGQPYDCAALVHMTFELAK